MTRFDLAILGGGPGGYSAAIRAAQHGFKVALIEMAELGGTCLNRGCIPTKVLTSTVGFLKMFERLGEYGIRVEKPRVDLKALGSRRRRIVESIRRGLQALLESYDIQILQGFGRLKTSNLITVSGKQQAEIEASKVILASGSSCPDKSRLYPEVEGVLTTDEALELEEPPSSILIVGGGPSGLEFACIFAALGCEVTVAEMLPQILPGEDSEISKLLCFSLEGSGVKVVTEARLEGLKSKGGMVEAFFQGGLTLEAERVLLAIGRRPNTENMGLEGLGIELVKGRIKVDEYQATNIQNIYAVGDVAGGLYAHTAFMEGQVAAENALGGRVKVDRKAVPRCVYTMPEVAGVGLTEEQALKAGYQPKTGRFPYAYNGRAQTLGETQGLVKLVADAKTGRILGVHMVGAEATELIAEAALAVKLDCTVEDLASTIHAHPTLAEALREAALEILGKPLHKPSG